MNEIILLVIGSACVGFSFAEVSQIPQAFSRFLLEKFDIGQELKQYNGIKVPYRIKPFDCSYCLSFWVGFLYAYSAEFPVIEALMVGFASSIVALILKRFV